MKACVPVLLLVVSTTFALSAAAIAEPRIEPSAFGSNWFVALDGMFMQTASKTGGQVNLTLDDSNTAGTDMSLQGADGIDHEALSPRASFGWRWNFKNGVGGGLQARFFDLDDGVAGAASLTPGTTQLQNFATTSETGVLEMYTGDVEAIVGYSHWGFTVDGTYGTRSAHFKADGEIEAFGVFTTGNFIQLQFSNGSDFEGDGHVKGIGIAYRVPQIPVSVFMGRRGSNLEGESNSFARVVGSVADSPSAPLIGAATVRRNNDDTELDITEARYGIQADFGAPGARFRSFARLTYETMEWELDGPPTGGAGFAGTIGTLTTNGFSTAGLGAVDLDGWSLTIGMAF
jgi:hypothetical protein